MSNYDDDNHSESASRRLIREAKEEAWHARRNLRRELPTPTAESKRQLACALADYRDLLLDYRDERALETPWDERRVNVDVIDQLLTETTTSSKSLNRRGNAQSQSSVQIVEQVNPHLLIQVAKELDAIAKELGFAAAAKDPVPQEEAEMSDLRGLLKARDQTEALKHLPGSDDSVDGDSQEVVADGGQ